jgi:hypothetical protein
MELSSPTRARERTTQELKLAVAAKSKALALAQKAAAKTTAGGQRGADDADAGSVSELSAENESLRLEVAYLRAKLVDQTKVLRDFSTHTYTPTHIHTHSFTHTCPPRLLW